MGGGGATPCTPPDPAYDVDFTVCSVFVTGCVCIRERLHSGCYKCGPLHGHHVAAQATDEQEAREGDNRGGVADRTGHSVPHPAAVPPHTTAGVAPQVSQVRV